jgi:hypothetical protein
MNTGQISLLSDPHRKLIAASAISEDVASARGYRTVTTRADLERLGFTRGQQNVPALLIPIRGVGGEIASYQVRPDQPRIDKRGKIVKYETPGKSRMVLDVPPTIRSLAGDPRTPLFITEGVRKADSAASLGLCCIGLLGVWNWRGTNHDGGKTVLPDWESIALRDRDVYIAFDSDATLKLTVYKAMDRLGGWLRSRGARVHFVLLPAS